MTKEKLIACAKEAAAYAYAPYSHFTVGAALLTTIYSFKRLDEVYLSNG